MGSGIRGILQIAAIFMTVMVVGQIGLGFFNVLVLSIPLTIALWLGALLLPKDEAERRRENQEEFQHMRRKANAKAPTAFDNLSARRRGGQAADRLAQAVRDIERAYGPYRTVTWEIHDPDVRVVTEGSSQEHTFSLQQVTGLDLITPRTGSVFESLAVRLDGEFSASSPQWRYTDKAIDEFYGEAKLTVKSRAEVQREIRNEQEKNRTKRANRVV